MLSKTTPFVNPKISLSTSAKTEAKHQRKFSEITLTSLEHLASLITQKPWSPILWENGERASKNFKASSLLVLDFDSGELTIDRCRDNLTAQNLSFLIGTTKSHQLEKKTPTGHTSPACDRFRLILVTKEVITCKDTYTENLAALSKIFPCDPSCKDSARFFFPCKEITSIHHGKKIPVTKMVSEKEEVLRKYYKKLEHHKKLNTLPLWILNALENGTNVGERHLTCYKLGATLTLLGYSEQEIITLVKKSPLSNIGEKEFSRAVTNGIIRSMAEHG